MRIAILGFGLIGGSLARAVATRAPAHDLVAWSPSGAGPTRAVADGVLMAAATSVEDAVRGADLVVIGAPPVAAIALVGVVAGLRGGALADDATVTDVVSTKRGIGEAADALALAFVGGHPMAGRETTGYAAADADLFVGRPWVVVPGRVSRAADIERVEWLAGLVGAQPIRMNAAEHDAAVAAISHLPLVLAAALVEAVVGSGSEGPRPDWAAVARLAATGWRDMTRLARGDVAMGEGIAITNAEPLAARLRDLRAVIDGWLADLESGPDGGADAAAIGERLRNARSRLDAG